MPKVLIAEDDLMIADMVEQILVAGGYEVCGIAQTVTDGITLGRQHKPDLAVIDLRLADGGIGTEIATELGTLGRLGVLYASGNITNLALTSAAGDACLAKPYRSTDLLRSLQLVAEIVANGTASPPFPHGFQVCRRQPSSPTGPLVNTDAAKVRKLLRQQAAIATFGSFALRQPNLLKVLAEAARVCADGLSVPFCKVCRYRAAENDLLIEAGYGWQANVVGHVVSRADESSPQGRAFLSGQPAICSDLRKDGNFVLPAFYAAHGIISTIDVVIKGDDRPYGVLEIDNNVQHDYDQYDINFLTGFANVLAEAVATASRIAVQEATVEQMRLLVEEKDRLLDQKKVLAQELQHRVRNNLQLIHGMLSNEMSDTAGELGIKAIARRVSTLAQVYDHLLGNEMTRTTDFGGYVKALCANLAAFQEPAGGGVTLSCHSDSVVLDLDAVTALGIIVTELVANSYEHAFAGAKGSIIVSVHRAANGSGLATMIVSDDGKGFEVKTENKRHGLGLVRRLVEQLRGTVVVGSDQGTVWTITFPVAETTHGHSCLVS